MELTGPAAGHEWLRTSADPKGRTVLGCLNNCAGGMSPWGTYLSGEENFNQYFVNAGAVEDPDKRASYERYGFGATTPSFGYRGWERTEERFDLAKEPALAVAAIILSLTAAALCGVLSEFCTSATCPTMSTPNAK